MSKRSVRKQRHTSEHPVPTFKERVKAGKEGRSLIKEWMLSLMWRNTINRDECVAPGNEGEAFDGALDLRYSSMVARRSVPIKAFSLPAVYGKQDRVKPINGLYLKNPLGKTARSHWLLTSNIPETIETIEDVVVGDETFPVEQ